MKRQLLLALGCLLLLAGWMSAFLSQSIPQKTDLYYLLPALLLGVGMGLLLKLLDGKRTAFVLALTAVAAIMAVNQLYPQSKISLLGFKDKLPQSMKVGKVIELQVRHADKTGVFTQPRQLHAVANVSVQLYSRLPGGARMLAFDDLGRLYVSLPQLGAIYQLQDSDKDGFAEQPVLYHVGLDHPHGLVWIKDRLYVAETGRLLMLRDADGDNQVDEVEVVLDGLPDDGGHWTRSLALGKDGYLYLSIGSRCNACDEKDPRRATILRVDPLTGVAEIFAKGLRNTVGLAFAPEGSALWGSDNGRDMLGDDLPPDEVNRIVVNGDYGWPYCYGQSIPDPELGNAEICRDSIPAAVDLPAHSAPLGIAFGDQLQAPEHYRNSLYVAFHGSWNRSVPTGYKLIRIPFVNGEPSRTGKEFLSGWLVDGKAWGRPVAPLAGPDGSLYLSDDRADAIYRITWSPQDQAQ